MAAANALVALQPHCTSIMLVVVDTFIVSENLPLLYQGRGNSSHSATNFRAVNKQLRLARPHGLARPLRPARHVRLTRHVPH